MNRHFWMIVCLAVVGCGRPSAPPTLDATGEKQYEQQQKQAAAAEGKGKPKEEKPED